MSDNRYIVISAEIEEDSVLCSGDFAISLYNKGHYGTPEKDGIRLDGFEALHLLELGRIEIKRESSIILPVEISEIFSAQIDNFMVRYYVYKDLRNRGYVVNLGKGSSFFFRLYQRDTKPKQTSAKYYVTALHEGGSIPLEEMNYLIKIAEQSKKILLLGMVDASGDVSYLKVNQLVPENISGDRPERNPNNWNWSTAVDELSLLKED